MITIFGTENHFPTDNIIENRIKIKEYDFHIAFPWGIWMAVYLTLHTFGCATCIFQKHTMEFVETVYLSPKTSPPPVDPLAF